VRVVPGPFGRTEIGLAFVLPGADARRVALAWRDALARDGR
jgi:hypothetical protein